MEPDPEDIPRPTITAATTLGCIEIAAQNGLDVEATPIEEIVNYSINGIFDWLRDTGHVPPIVGSPDQRLADFLISQNLPSEELKAALESGDERLIQQVREKEARFLKEATERVNRDIQERGHQRAMDIVKDYTPEEIPEPIYKSLNLESVNRMSIDNLAKLAPNDVLLQKITKGVVQPYYRWAVEVVYTQLSMEHWGTAMAEQLIADMVQRHEKFLKEIGDVPTKEA